MIRILLNGCNGRMGQVITRLVSMQNDMKIVSGVDINQDKVKNSYPVFKNIDDITVDADVAIDFSNVKGLPILIGYCIKKKLPVVVCTTGLSDNDKNMLSSAADEIAVLTSANMSIGVNLVMSLVKTAVRVLGDSFDIEIIEKHHRDKADSPSGTALAIADSINSVLNGKKEYVYGRHSTSRKRKFSEIGIHSIRGGNIVGDHSIIFAGDGEVIEIKHSAISRDVFASGALQAAKYIYNKKNGFYSMDDVISRPI